MSGKEKVVEPLFSKDKIGVVVTILPLANFVEQVGKDRVEVGLWSLRGLARTLMSRHHHS